MIDIKVDLKRWKLSMKGHAQYDEKGKDIVCAGASMLFYTLWATLEQYTNDLSIYKKEVKEDEVSVRFKPVKEYEQTIAVVLLTIVNGFNLLSQEYHDNVKLTIKE